MAYAPFIQDNLNNAGNRVVSSRGLSLNVLVQKGEHAALMSHGSRPRDMTAVGKEASCRIDGHTTQKRRVGKIRHIVFDVRIRGVRLPVNGRHELGYELDP